MIDKVDISDRFSRDLGKANIAGIDKGSIVTAINAISGTATSNAIAMQGYHGVDVEVIVTGVGNWDIEITGCSILDGNFLSNDPQLIKQGITASTRFSFSTTASYIKVIATENSGTATVTVKVTPVIIPVSNELKASIYGKNVAAGDTAVLVDASGNVQVTLATTLSSVTDSIDVAKMSKGGVTTAHSAITATATSSEIDCRGFNAISVEMAASALSAGNWVASILGCAVSGGTFGACYTPRDDGTFVAQATPAISANGNTTYYFKGIPNYVKILATRTTDGTLTVKCTPMNL